MTVLDESGRAQVWRGFMRYVSSLNISLALSGPNLRAAVDATDNWIDSNQSSYNTALPAAAQGGLTAPQKTLLFCAVAARRVSPAFARLLFGGLD